MLWLWFALTLPPLRSGRSKRAVPEGYRLCLDYAGLQPDLCAARGLDQLRWDKAAVPQNRTGCAGSSRGYPQMCFGRSMKRVVGLGIVIGISVGIGGQAYDRWICGREKAPAA